jgi:thymidylate synthase ThyX
MIYNRGFKNISVDLLNVDDQLETLAMRCFNFGKHGEFYQIKDEYDHQNPVCQKFVDDIMNGRTFPKYLFEGTNIEFKINDISRICLAQLTREKGFFCSESSATYPLSNNWIIPENVYNNKDWMMDIREIGMQLEHLYIRMLEAGIPYMDARYFMPHAQTISLSWCTTAVNFMSSCASRTRNDFCDEINYLFRKMYYQLKWEIEHLRDPLSKKLWQFLIKKAWHPYMKQVNPTYGKDMLFHSTDDKTIEDRTPQNDWRNSCWKLEMERMYYDEDHLLFPGEKEMIDKWIEAEQKGDLWCSCNPEDPSLPQNAIKEADYYEKG